MNRILIYFIAVSGLMSCGNDLETSTDLVDTPIIYGLLSLADTAQYIRIERAFLEEGIDANVLAQDPDRVYYDESVAVSLVEIGGTEEIRVPLERVNGTDEGYPRNDGTFLTDPNFLYKLPTSVLQLKEDRRYRLEVDRPDLPIVSSTTSIVGEAVLGTPLPIFPVENRTIPILPHLPLRIILNSGSARNAALLDYALIVRLTEISTAGAEEKILEWDVARNLTERDAQVPGLGFYSFLNAELEADPAINRRIQEISVKVSSASQAFADFRDVLNANSGITGAEDVPIFTNIDGGRGIFASRNTLIVPGFSLTGLSVDSLRSNQLTRPLNFAF